MPDIIIYLEDSKSSTRKLLDLVNKFSKVAGYKINIHKSKAFLYISEKSSEKEMKKTIPFTITSKKRYLGINLMKEVKGLYKKNYRNLKEKKSRKILKDGKIYFAHL